MSTKVICQTPKIGLHIIDYYSKRSMESLIKLKEKLKNGMFVSIITMEQHI